MTTLTCWHAPYTMALLHMVLEPNEAGESSEDTDYLSALLWLVPFSTNLL